MEAVKDHLLPDPNLSRQEMKNMQREVSREADFHDRFGFDASLKNTVVAGIDQAFLDGKAVSAVVVMKDGEVLEKIHGVTELEMPYIPGLLAFREMPAIVDALERLSTEPDVLLLDGSGRIHYREAGIATHAGAVFDKPAIGIAKNLLCGKPVSDIDRLEEGDQVEIITDESVKTAEDAVLGYAYQSRQYTDSYRINPIFVSPGHRVSVPTTVELVSNCVKDYKLPEPTRIADRYVDEVKKEL